MSRQHRTNAHLSVVSYNCEGIIVGETQRRGQFPAAHDLIALPVDNLLESLVKWWEDGHAFVTKIELLNTLVIVKRLRNMLAIQSSKCEGKTAKGPMSTICFEISA